MPAISQLVYDGEENVVQGGINLVTLTGYSAATVSEAFDEPLTAAQVLTILQPFVRFRRGRDPMLNNNDGAEKSSDKQTI